MSEFAHKVIEKSSIDLISLDDAKLHLRVDFTDDDNDIERMITAVTHRIENHLRRFLLETTIEQSFPGWGFPFELKFLDVISFEKMEYFDVNNDLIILDASNFEIAKLMDRSLVIATAHSTRPVLADRIDPVKMTYKCGYGDAVEVIPPDIIDAAYLLLSEKYERGMDRENLHNSAMEILSKHRVF